MPSPHCRPLASCVLAGACCAAGGIEPGSVLGLFLRRMRATFQLAPYSAVASATTRLQCDLQNAAHEAAHHAAPPPAGPQGGGDGAAGPGRPLLGVPAAGVGLAAPPRGSWREPAALLAHLNQLQRRIAQEVRSPRSLFAAGLEESSEQSPGTEPWDPPFPLWVKEGSGKAPESGQGRAACGVGELRWVVSCWGRRAALRVRLLRCACPHAGRGGRGRWGAGGAAGPPAGTPHRCVRVCVGGGRGYAWGRSPPTGRVRRLAAQRQAGHTQV